ncbi:MAG TPA: MerR family transcriptional regulator [Thermoanaerobaculia bacterium]|nr:MerR family transcriptional regulator [Thermoanaerobaculia bacterium]
MPRRSKRKYVMISSVAERYDIHPQTLRMYEREGLLKPRRSEGNTRLYDDEAIARLESILILTRDMGVNLAGVEVILRLQEQLEAMAAERDRLRELLDRQARERSTAILRKHALVRIRSAPLVKRGES